MSTNTSTRDEQEPLLRRQAHYNYDASPGPVIASSHPHQVHQEGRLQSIKVYKRRWYILAAFCLMNFSQNIVWNTWAPISDSVQEAFGWDTATIALQTNWGPIAFIISAVFFGWLMDTKGLRWAVLPSAALVMTGSGIRCITATPPAVTWVNHVGQLLNGLAGPVAMSAQPVISATWFPPNQRTTATAIGTIVGGIGLGVSFIIGPLFVPQMNSTHNHNSSSNDTDIPALRNSIMRLVYVEAGISALSFLVILIYFPTRPPLPPSLSSSIQRLNFKEGFKKLIRHRKFWTLGMVYGVSSGVFNAWSSVINMNLRPLGVPQATSGWLGFYGTVAGNVAAILISIPADFYKRKMKWLLFALYTFGAASFLCFALVCNKVIPFHNVWLYSTMISGCIALVSGVPLFFELVCEATYPIAEGVTNSLLTLLNNVAALLFYLVLMAPVGGPDHKELGWMNWCMFGSVTVCLPLVLAYQQKLTRYDIDTGFIRVNTDSAIDEPHHT